MTEVLELADIAGEWVLTERIHRCGREPTHLTAELASGSLEKMTREIGNVLGTLSQRGQAKANDIEPMK
jgi:hypothetical protein